MKRCIACSILVSFLFLSCQKTKEESSRSVFREKLNNIELMDGLLNLALNHGDTLAYRKLQAIYYIGDDRISGFLYYALVMSNKYNYKEASIDVHHILTNSDGIIDDKTREMADFYWVKSQTE